MGALDSLGQDRTNQALTYLDQAARTLVKREYGDNQAIYGVTTLNDDPDLTPVQAHARVLRAFDLALKLSKTPQGN